MISFDEYFHGRWRYHATVCYTVYDDLQSSEVVVDYARVWGSYCIPDLLVLICYCWVYAAGVLEGLC